MEVRVQISCQNPHTIQFWMLLSLIYATTHAANLIKTSGKDTECFSCVQEGHVTTCDEKTTCKPKEEECLALQFTDTNGTTVYYRGCNIQDFQAIPDGCSCDDSGSAFFCKKTCVGDNCNNNEHMSSVDQVKSLMLVSMITTLNLRNAAHHPQQPPTQSSPQKALAQWKRFSL